MQSLIRSISAATLVWFGAAPAAAQDSSSGDAIDNLLNSIPQIETQAPEESEADKAPPPEPADLFPAYLVTVKASLMETWSPPGSIKKHQGLWNQVLIMVDSQGQITKMALIESSGDAKFDKSVTKALNAANLPAPPPSIQYQAMQGLPIKFRAVDKL